MLLRQIFRFDNFLAMEKSLRIGQAPKARLMRILFALAVITALVSPAYGQQKQTPQPAPGPPPKTQKQIEEDKAADRAYQKSLQNIPDQPAADPWGNARSTDAPKTTAKSKSSKAPAN
jgi:hypothetical protein